MIKNRLLSAAVLAAVLLPATAMATNGMFMMGNGTKANGRAGAGIAVADSAMSGADNPASMVRLGNRVDFGIQIFQPDRNTTISGNDISNVPLPATQLNQLNGGLAQQGFDQLNPGATYSSPITAGGQNTGFNVADMFAIQGGAPQIPGVGAGVLSQFNYSDDGNGDGPFYIPEGGINFMINDSLSAGLVVAGTGGMNTSYNNLAMFGAGLDGSVQESTGINLEQVRILPTLSYKINNEHSVGVSLQIAYQQFKAWGLQRFTSESPFDGRVSQAPNHLDGKGRDDSLGYGISVGWQGQLTSQLTMGVVYNSKISMDDFDDYDGLFADDGNLDIPENYGIGLAFQATEDLMLAFDIQQINYSDVKSIGNSIQSGPNNSGGNMFNPANYLGTKNGSGFGWDDMTVYKIGAEYQVSDALLLRTGYSHADQPISKDQTMFGILAPATIEDHVSLGMTYTLPHGSEISMFYMHAFENKVKGSGSIPGAFGGGEADIEMSQNAFGIAYGWNF